MAYIIHNGKRPLSYWFPNNNFYGKVKDIIGFGFKSYFIFQTEEEANDKLKGMFNNFKDMEGEIKLSFKIWRILEKLKVNEKEF